MRKDTQIIKSINFDLVWLGIMIVCCFTIFKDSPDILRFSLVLISVLRVFIEMSQTVYNRIEKAEANILEDINKNNKVSL